MERKDVMSKNVAIYAAQAAALEKGAAPGCKVGGGCAGAGACGANARDAVEAAGALGLSSSWSSIT